MKRLLLIVLVAVCSVSASAQDAETLKQYRTTPVWISMIDQPRVNYFEALKAFDTYWEGREMPMEEEDILGERFSIEEKRLGIFRIFFPKSKESRELAFEVKRFRNWQRKVLPLVQDDGSILSKEEELEIYRTQNPQ